MDALDKIFYIKAYIRTKLKFKPKYEIRLDELINSQNRKMVT